MSFAFSEECAKRAEEILACYPENRRRSAVMGLLYIAQEQNSGWISSDVIRYISEYLAEPVVKIMEVASFYTMFNLAPVGKYLIQLCGTTPCALRGANLLIGVCKSELGVGLDETTSDGLFTLKEVECLGACSNAPVVQINNWYYEDLSLDSFLGIIRDLRSGIEPSAGSASGRKSAEPGCALDSVV